MVRSESRLGERAETGLQRVRGSGTPLYNPVVDEQHAGARTAARGGCRDGAACVE